MSPAGQFLSSTQIPLSIRNSRTGRNRSSSQTQRKKTGLRSVLPPMSRDRPEKWVKRNRLAAVVSSAVFIPAMCAGFGYLGKFLCKGASALRQLYNDTTIQLYDVAQLRLRSPTSIIGPLIMSHPCLVSTLGTHPCLYIHI